MDVTAGLTVAGILFGAILLIAVVPDMLEWMMWPSTPKVIVVQKPQEYVLVETNTSMMGGNASRPRRRARKTPKSV